MHIDTVAGGADSASLGEGDFALKANVGNSERRVWNLSSILMNTSVLLAGPLCTFPRNGWYAIPLLVFAAIRMEQLSLETLLGCVMATWALFAIFGAHEFDPTFKLGYLLTALTPTPLIPDSGTNYTHSIASVDLDVTMGIMIVGLKLKEGNKISSIFCEKLASKKEQA